MNLNALSIFWRAGCIAAFGALSFAPVQAGESVKQPVFVELYTSQGCSSCPAADQLMGELQKRDDVVALSFNVDYWDYIGWRDTLASHANTLRQQSYEKVLPSHRVYTPQMVVDGQQDVVGNARRDVVQAIDRRLGETRGKRLSIAIAQAGDTVQVRIGAGTKQAATIWLAHTLSSRAVNIAKGENGGKVVTYYNVVRGFSAVGKWTGEAVTLTLPARAEDGEINDGVAVWVQGDGNGPVLGAAQARVTGR